jgi:hypothetical protein
MSTLANTYCAEPDAGGPDVEAEVLHLFEARAVHEAQAEARHRRRYGVRHLLTRARDHASSRVNM